MERLQAGAPATITFTFEIGEQAIPVGGQLGIAWRWAFDWGDLQTTDPQTNGYLSLCRFSRSGEKRETSGLSAKYHPYSGVEPWHHFLSIEVEEDSLEQGDRVVVVCGDKSQGSEGWLAPTCSAKESSFLILIDPEGKKQWIRLLDPPTFAIVPGAPSRLAVVAPSEVVVGTQAEILLRVEDCWGNPTLLDNGTPNLQPTSDYRIIQEPLAQEDPPVYLAVIEPVEPKVMTLNAICPGVDGVTESNPVRISMTPLKRPVFWGDFHSGQCEIGCGQSTLTDHYRFGRDAAGLQFMTHQANDHYVTVAEWEHIRETTEALQEPGRFIPLLGCEWSPPTPDGGDRNVAYLYDEPLLRRSGRFFVESEPDPEPDLPRAAEFLEAMKHEEVLINMHVGGRPTNLDYHEPLIERLAEAHSTHGTSEWFIVDALQRGYKFGVTAGTDGVMGRPGACQPGRRLIRNLPNGLTAVRAESLTKEAIWEALKARRCYATTGARILLDFDINGTMMGEDLKTDEMPLARIGIAGTAAVEAVTLFRGTDILCKWQLAPFRNDQFRLLWGGTQKKGTARAQTVNWNGFLTVENGSVEVLEQVGYFSAVDQYRQCNSQRIEWESATAGNEAGLILKLDGEEVIGQFQSGPCSFSFARSQIARAPLVVAAGGVGRMVTIGPAPEESASREAELSFRDTLPRAEEVPYWIRVIQVDRQKAWSSPVFVTWTG